MKQGIKHFLLQVALALATTSIPALQVLAEQIAYSDPLYQPGFHLVSEGPSGLTMTFSVTSWRRNPVVIDGTSYQQISIPAVCVPGICGEPDVPRFSRLIAVPAGASVTATVTSYRTDSVSNIALAPVADYSSADLPPYRFNSNVYLTNSYYPVSLIEVSESFTIRGITAVYLTVNPFRVNPVSKTLEVYRDIAVSIGFQGGSGDFCAAGYRSAMLDDVYNSAFFNSASIQTQPLEPDFSSNDYDYIIICPDNPGAIESAEVLRRFREEQGIHTGVFLTTVTGNTAQAIDGWIIDQYNSQDNKPDAIMLLGDFADIPAAILHDGNPEPYYSDQPYADVDENDLSDIPSLVISRIPASHTIDSGETMSLCRKIINKIITYETAPPVPSLGNDSLQYYSHTYITGEWDPERWFILSSEVIRGYLGTTSVAVRERAYAAANNTPPSPGSDWTEQYTTQANAIVDYFSDNNDYQHHWIQQTPCEVPGLCDWHSWDGSVSSNIEMFNTGSFLIMYNGHGSNAGWGAPALFYSDASHVFASRSPSIVMSMGCSTGAFANNVNPPNFSEAFLRHSSAAAGILAPTGEIDSFYTDIYLFGFYDYIWPGLDTQYGADGGGAGYVLPAFGNLSAMLYLYNHGSIPPWQHGLNDTQDIAEVPRMMHYFGDPYTPIYTANPYLAPIAVTVTGNAIFANATSVRVTASPGTFVVLSVGGVVIGTGTGNGTERSISITPQEEGTTVTVVGTRPQSARFTAQVPVIWTPPIVYENKSSETQMQYPGQPLNGGIVDYDNDTRKDLMITISGLNGLALPCDRFTDDGVPIFPGQENPWSSPPEPGTRGLIFADYDNDGWTDFFAPHLTVGRLYHNVNGTFVDVTTTTGLAALVDSTTTGSWGDFDSDGDVDLFVVKTSQNGEPYGGRGVLIRNDVSEDGKFYGAQGPWSLPTNSALWADFDGDKDLDLFAVPSSPYLATLGDPPPDYSPYYWINDGDGTFTSGEGMVDNWRALFEGTYAAATDADQDGDTDIVFMTQSVSGYAENDGAGYFAVHQGNPHGVELDDIKVVDYDLDGFPDIIGSIHPMNHGENGTVGVFGNRLGINGKRVFVDETALVGTFGTAQQRGIVAGDFHEDGDTELYLSRATSAPFFFEAHTAAGHQAVHWVGVKLASLHGANNRFGLGAKVTVTANGKSWSQVVDGGSGRAGQGEPSLVFGLGGYSGSVNVAVSWPNGRGTSCSVPSDQYATIEDNSPAVDESSVHCHLELLAQTGRNNWYFEWQTYFCGWDPLDKVIFEMGVIPQRCRPAYAELTPLMTGIVDQEVTPLGGNKWLHKIWFLSTDCVARCNIPFRVQSQLAGLAASRSRRHILQIPACLQPSN